ncbi:Metallo-dependent phosphatase-like protein [Panaeolus papilionaceus]|nr:Metallo-dependent phosphatase-like protein [Panaeolus papilionaceus]
MSHSLQALLNKIEYSPTQDVLVHVGDMVAKGPHKGSLAVLDFMTKNNIIGVRGNHDQVVIEWRAWIEWVQTMPGGTEWLHQVDKQWAAARRANKNLDPKDWSENKRNSCYGPEKRWWRLVPEHWVVQGDHYQLARDITPYQYQYLLNLPLRLFIPSAHVFVMHAGMLPFDPRYSDTDERQPLAHSPYIRDRIPNIGRVQRRNRNEHSRRNHLDSPTDIDEMRNVQEIALLSDIPQNRDLWTTLNMRTVREDGRISNKPKKGTYWTKIWTKEMKKCAGFDIEDMETSEKLNTTWPVIYEWKHKTKHTLPCYPSTAVYGHTASRGLEVKRWSVGLDSGCVSYADFYLACILTHLEPSQMYGRTLSALIVGGTKRNVGVGSQLLQPVSLHDHDSSDFILQERQEVEQVTYSKSFPFGDRARGMLVSLNCKLP